MGLQGPKGKVHAAACLSCFHWNKANGTMFKAPKQEKKKKTNIKELFPTVHLEPD